MNRQRKVLITTTYNEMGIIIDTKAEEVAQPERILYANMSDAEFEKWLYEHGICNPNIHESIPCDAVPLLIDSAISELPTVVVTTLPTGHVYRCDPEKNKSCRKTGCYINGGDCYLTQHAEYAKEVARPEPYKEDNNG